MLERKSGSPALAPWAHIKGESRVGNWYSTLDPFQPRPIFIEAPEIAIQET